MKTEVAIVGAGIAGASLAWRLSQAGVDVVVLEREAQAGVHSTGRSAALFMESYGPAGVRALTRAGHAFYQEPPSGFATVPILHLRRSMYVARPDQFDRLQAFQREVAAGGTQLRPLGGSELRALIPVLRAGVIERAVLDERASDMDVDALLQGFLRGARASGARLHMSTWITRARYGSQGWTLTLCNESVLQARVVVDAAGAWVDEVAEQLGVRRIGLQPKRRSAFMFAGPADLDFSVWPSVTDVSEQWYFKPDAGQLLGSPANADPVPPHDVQPEDLDIAMAIDHIQRATTLEIRRPTATWAGLRSFVPDGELVIGFDDEHPGFFWLAGQGGYGIQSAAGASLLASCLIRRAELPPALTAQGLNPELVSPRRLR